MQSDGSASLKNPFSALRRAFDRFAIAAISIPDPVPKISRAVRNAG